jgi:TPP-dependent pyruvate/acetoin dehydrogenase alpha subunit
MATAPRADKLPPIRAGMGDIDAPAVEVWSDEDQRRATGLLTLLSPDGQLNRAAMPALSAEAARDAYRTMLRMRALGERARALVSEGRIAGYPDARGAEAAIVGAAAALVADDYIVPGPREAAVALHRGLPVAALAAQIYGNANDIGRGHQPAGHAVSPRALNVTPASLLPATQLPHAAGIAWAMKMQRRPQLALAYLDRVATSAEDFHAGLNFAAVFCVPAVFVCANDAAAGAAAAVPETMSETLAVKALAYGMPGVRVDGGDLFAVYAATAEAAERARAGRGPTFIEAVISADDPLDRLRLWLTSQKLVDDASLRKQVEAEIAAAFDAEAKVGPPALHTMIEHVVSTPPAALEEALRRH